MTLGVRSFSAARWTTLSSLLRAALQLAQVAVLTRYLSPADYGLMALITVVISYGSLFSDMGLSTAFVQRQQISQEERSSLYWLSVVIGAGLMLLVMLVSPVAAWAFKEPQLVWLLMLVSTNFLVVALGQQLRMDAEKSLNFRPVAIIEIVAAASGFAAAVFTAWLGWGVYALVVAAMLSIWLGMVLSWVLLARGWRPLWRLRWAEVHWFVRFGGGMVINNFINHINTTVDILLAGRLLGVSQLGLYSVPRNIILQIQFMVNPVFTRVGFPVIASIQGDLARVQAIYLRIMNITATVNAPIYVIMAVFSPELVQIFLGEKFQDTADLFRILAIWGLFRSFGNPAGSLLFGLGHVRLAILWNGSLLLIIPPILWWGSHYGVTGMAWIMAAVMIALFVPLWAILVRPVCGAGLWAYSKQVLSPTLCALVAGGVAWLAVNLLSFPILRLGLGLCVGVIAYIALSWWLNRGCVGVVLGALRRMPNIV